MATIDLATALMYLGAFLYTRQIAFAVCIPVFAASMYVGWDAVEMFSARKGGYEFFYFLIQSFIWLAPAVYLRKNMYIALSVLLMSICEWLVAVESFVWQFITPVETFMHREYAFIILAIHLTILASLTKWGAQFGYLTFTFDYRRKRARNISRLQIHYKGSSR